MRLSVVIPFLAVGMLAALSALLLIHSSSNGKAREQPGTPMTEGPAPSQAETDTLTAEKPVTVPPAPEDSSAEAASSEAAAKHQAYVADRCSELAELATDERPESLATILSELTNRDPEIRKAATSAAKQFGSRDAVPRLMEALTQTEAPEEKLALMEAVEFLQLPSLGELAERARTNSATGPP